MTHYAKPCPECGGRCDSRSAVCRPCTMARRKRAMGRVHHSDGYVRVCRWGHPLAGRDGYVFEHRLVMFEAGIAVGPDEVIHHRNGDKADNRIENLAVFSNAAHARHHAEERGWIRNQFGTFPLRSLRGVA